MSADDVKAWETALREGPVLDVVARECLGRHGYGTGRVVSGNASGSPLGPPVETPAGPGVPIVGGCEACPENMACWELTREAARGLLPELMSIVDGIIADGLAGAEAMRAWAERTGQPSSGSLILPPDLLLESLHLRIGAEHTVRVVVQGGA